MIGLPYGEKKYDDMLSHFHLIPERYGRTDRQTDGQICYINIAHQYAELLMCDKNCKHSLQDVEKADKTNIRQATFAYLVFYVTATWQSKEFMFAHTCK